jgi:hypothetical protein
VRDHEDPVAGHQQALIALDVPSQVLVNDRLQKIEAGRH